MTPAKERSVISLRLPRELVAGLDSEAARRGSSRTALLEEGARLVLGEPASSGPASKARAKERAKADEALDRASGLPPSGRRRRAAPPPKRPPAVASAWTCPQHGGYNTQPHCLVTGCVATMKAIK